MGWAISPMIIKYGAPYTSEASVNQDGINIESICYKELVGLSNETYVLNTCLYFEDNVLVKREQHTEYPQSKMDFLKKKRNIAKTMK